jgi:molybdopterin molybdotransferase
MPEFLQLQEPKRALDLLLSQLPGKLLPEIIATELALNRVTYAEVAAKQPLPAFSRSTVDGFAVRSPDTFGASESLPVYMTIIGEVPMGAEANIGLNSGECILIHTGGMLPENADAVVMLENTEQTLSSELEIFRAVSPGENVLQVGEDVKAGEPVIQPGVRLRPAEIGGLMALGFTQIQVTRKPLVGIISSGDEVIPPEQEPLPGQVRDINAYTLSALVEQYGGIAQRYGIATDQAEELEKIAKKALAECDVLVITAGSSASVRDLTATVINRLGSPGILVHGVNVKPGKPTILGVCDQKAVIGLPGNPVSALVIAGLFVVPVVEYLLGLSGSRLRSSLVARLAINLSSQAGREDWIPVRIISRKHENQVDLIADPIFGKSNLIYSLVRADGFIRIQPDATGLAAGDLVNVVLF